MIYMSHDTKRSTSSQRSRFGCLRCKKASRKCDEKKPICSRCHRLDIDCNYDVRFIWKHGQQHFNYDPVIESASRRSKKRRMHEVTEGNMVPLLVESEHRHIQEPLLDKQQTTTYDLATGLSSIITGQHSDDGFCGRADSQLDIGLVQSIGSLDTSRPSSIPPAEDKLPVELDLQMERRLLRENSSPAPRMFVNLPYWKTVFDLDGEDFQTLRDFLTNGQRRLHFSSLLHNPVVDDMLPKFSQSTVLVNAVLSFQSSQFHDANSLMRFQKAVGSYRGRLSDMPALELESICVAGLILCCTSMHMGYSWTAHIGGLLSLAEKTPGNQSLLETSIVARTLEWVAGVDMDVWVVGRRTPPHHIWSRLCCGRPGIEKMTGLPRSLLDIIAKVSLREDATEELIEWSSQLNIENSSYAEYHIWQAYCIAALLQLHLWCIVKLEDTAALADMVRSHVEAFHSTTSEADLSPRMALWPLYIIGLSTEDTEMRSYVIRRLKDKSLCRDFRSKNFLGKILQELWMRLENGELVTPDLIAWEHNVEMGIW